jgi:choline dehydrogenase-like flavoprotein/nucleoside-diphosphate-sugar epimerase
MRVVVTGAAGQVGLAVSRRAVDGAALVGVDDRPGHGFAGEFHVAAIGSRGWERSITEAAPDVVVHLVRVEQGAEPRVRNANVAGLESTLAAAARVGVAHVVVLSSTAVYGPGRGPVSELHPVEGAATRYPLARHCAELEGVARAWRRRGGGSVSVVRPVEMMGPGGAGALVRVLRALRVVPVPTPGIGVQLVHPDDVATAIWACVAHRFDGPVNVAAPDVIELGELAYRLGASCVRGGRVLTAGALDLAMRSGRCDVPPSFADFLRHPRLVDLGVLHTELSVHARWSAHEVVAAAPAGVQPGLSERQRRVWAAVGAAALPRSNALRGFARGDLSHAEAVVAGAGSGAIRGLGGALWALEASTLVTRGSRFSRLREHEQGEVVDRMARSKLTASVARLTTIPLKAAWASSTDYYDAIGCVAPKPVAPEVPRWHQGILAPADLESELEVDVVVVGTGAGGGPVAEALSRKGHVVLMLEEGAHFTREHFTTGRPLDRVRAMYRDGGLTTTLGNVPIPVPLGRTVGGTTTINSGTCFRVPGAVLARWRDAYGLTELTEEALGPYFERVERVIGVTVADMAHVGAPGRVIARGCDALGYSHHALARNAPDCDGQGLCCFGCPTDAKRSSNVTWVPAALEQSAFVAPGFRVERVLVDRGRAWGVRGRVRSESGGWRDVTVRARAVVLAAGAIGTPELLMRSGLAGGSGWLGRNLSIHPATHALARFDERIEGWNTIPQGYCIDEFAADGLMFEGAAAPVEMLGAALHLDGAEYAAAMAKMAHMAAFGFMIKDTSRGRVVRVPGGRSQLLYWLNRADTAQLVRGMAILARVFFAAGALEVYPALSGFGVLRGEEDVRRMEGAGLRARHFELTAYHPLGTARMGADPRASVVGSNNEVYGVKDLYVADGSSVPGSLGVNPQVTIMALALRAADTVERRIQERE